MVEQPAPTRREQRRAETLQEITALAMDQIATNGPDSLSLNGVARAMNMSPAAIYRYFDGRDALLTQLVVDAYDSLADALEAAAQTTDDVRERLILIMNTSHAWALAHPNAYRLIFQSHAGSGQDLAPARTIQAASRSMSTLLTALAGAAGHPSASSPRTTATADVVPLEPLLRDQLEAWAERSGHPELPPSVVALAIAAWTRLHGLISLELGRHLASTGIDPALLYAAEVDTLVDQAHRLCHQRSEKSET